jgi:site-specific recombinase XerD
MKRPEKLPRGIFVRNEWYWIRYTDQHGRLHREKASPLLSGALKALEKRRTEIRERKFFPEKFRQRSVIFSEIARDYLELALRRKRTWREDEDHLRSLAALNDVPVSDLTPGHLETVLDSLGTERHWSPATFNRYRSSLSAVFALAIKNRKVESNPARSVTHRKEENQRVRYLTAEEETRLLEVVRDRWPEREADIIVALHSGMRRSELYLTAKVPDGGLRWAYVNFTANVIRLPRSKASRARAIPMNSVLRETLRLIPRRLDSCFVFESTGRENWFAEAVEEAGIEDFTWHCLRHTFASRLVMAGIPIRTVAELLGHGNIQTTMRYAHLAPGHLASAVEALVVSPKLAGELAG